MKLSALVFAALAAVMIVNACGGPEPTSQVLVVTATFTPQPEAVETAASTPSPEVIASEAVPSPSPTDTPVLEAPAPPTASTQAEPTVTLRPTQTASPIPLSATETPVPETPTLAPTAAPSATSKPRTSLASYRVIYSHFDGGDQADENKYSVWVMRGDGQQAATDQQVLGKWLCTGWKQRCAVAAEGERVQRQHHDVTDPQQDVAGPGQQPRAEHAVEKRHGAALTRKSHREPGIRVGRQERHTAGDQERGRCAAAGELDRQAQDREDASPHHPAYTYGHHTPQSDAVASGRAHQRKLDEHPARAGLQ